MTTSHPDDSPDQQEHSPIVVGRADLFRLVQASWDAHRPFDLHSVRLDTGDLLSGRFFNLDLSQALAAGYQFTDPQGGRGRFQQVCFREADLARANFQNCHFEACSFRSADLMRADFRYTLFESNPDLGFLYAEMTGADFSYAMIQGADLRGANAPGLVAVRASMAYCDFRGANLAGADFMGADLRCCDFTRATLTGACLSSATIEGCDFSDAVLDESDLERISEMCLERPTVFVQWRHKGDSDTSLPGPIPARMYNPPFVDRYTALAPPVLSDAELVAAVADYARYIEECGIPPETGPDSDEEEEEERDEEGQARTGERNQEEESFPASSDPFLPDFPDD